MIDDKEARGNFRLDRAADGRFDVEAGEIARRAVLQSVKRLDQCIALQGHANGSVHLGHESDDADKQYELDQRPAQPEQPGQQAVTDM